MTDGIAALSSSSNLSAIDALLENSKKTNKEEDEKQKDIFDLMFQAIDDGIAKTQENLGKINENSSNNFDNSKFGVPANIKIEHLEEDSPMDFVAQKSEDTIKSALMQFKANQSYTNANVSNLMKSAFEAIF